MSDNTRERLAKLLEILDGDTYAAVASAVLAALHPEVTTEAELDALPVGSVVLFGPDEPAVKRFMDEWVVAGSAIECTTGEMSLAINADNPVPVLYRPDVGEAS